MLAGRVSLPLRRYWLLVLEVTIPGVELYHPDKEMFEYGEEVTLSLEHSLISISKWESKWKKPWFSQKPKTMEEIRDYIRCMTLNKNVPIEVYSRIPSNIQQAIVDYIDDSMTATTFRKTPNQPKSHEIVTSEVIYYWMTVFNIPPEYQKWHINRLLTLIQVCGENSKPKKKMSQREQAQLYYSLNEARRQQYGTKG